MKENQACVIPHNMIVSMVRGGELEEELDEAGHQFNVVQEHVLLRETMFDTKQDVEE